MSASLPDSAGLHEGESSPWPSGRRTWFLLAGCWVLFVVLMGSPPVLNQLIQGNPLPWRSVGNSLAYACLWACLAPAVFWLSRRFPLDRAAWRRSLGVHLVAGLAVWLLDRSFVFGVDQLFHTMRWPDPPPATAGEKFLRILGAGLPLAILNYWTLVGVSQAIASYRLFRDRELEAWRLEGRLARTRLHALKMQLQPDFLLETLATIARLVEEDPKAADRMIARLSDVLRLALENDGREEVSLREELELLDPYLRIEEARYAGRLAVRHDVDPEALDETVPAQILQPLVDTAIRRRLAAGAGRARLEIVARRGRGGLRLEVRCGTSDGDRAPLAVAAVGAVESVAANGGGGCLPELQATRDRLRQLYGGDHPLEVARFDDRGLELAMTIPCDPGCDPEPAGEVTSAARVNRAPGRAYR